MKQTEDFLLFIIHSYVIAAEQRQKTSDTFQMLSQIVVKCFAKIYVLLAKQKSKSLPIDDMINNYSTNLLTFVFFGMAFMMPSSR